MDVKIVTVDKGPLDSGLSGFYTETLFINGTNCPIYIIDANNGRVVVPPNSHAPRVGFMTVIVRGHNGPRTQRDKLGRSMDLLIPTHIIDIPQWLIERGGYLETHTDCVLASETAGPSLNHPKQDNRYIEALESAVAHVTNDGSLLVASYQVNDPKGRASVIYANLEGAVVAIPVTRIKDMHASFNLVVNDSKKSYITTRLDITGLFDTGRFVSTELNSCIVLGLTPDEVVNAYNELISSKEQMLSDAVTKRMTLERDQNKQTVSSLEKRVKLAEDAKANDIVELKNKLQASENKLVEAAEAAKRAKLQVDEWKTLYEARADTATINQRIYTDMDKRLEQELKARRAEEAERAERMNNLFTGCKIVGGLLIGTVLPMILKKK